MEVNNRKRSMSISTTIFLALLSIVVLMTAYFFSMVFNVFPDDKISIKLSDSSKCILKKYSFEMPEMTISFSANQFDIATSSSGGRPLLEIPIASTAPEQLTYWIRAEYENCPEIKSEPRVVGRGYIIYESIFNNQIDFDIRAK